MRDHDIKIRSGQIDGRNDTNTATAIPIGVPFDPSKQVVGLARSTGEACFMARTDAGPPRIDGYTVGAPIVTQDPPHGGEMHPDGDELLYVVSGRINVSLELDAERRDVEVRPGEALVVPRGVWHLITLQEPGQLIHITPGPGGGHRPLPVSQS
jgi:mannose-6-phosphate isomerase-like protein (cupin superfamily)